MQNIKVKNHNYLLDVFKFIAALFIVVVHVNIDGQLPYLTGFFAGEHLWFILALLYVYIYLYIFLRLAEKSINF